MSPDQAGLQLEILSQKRGRGGGVREREKKEIKGIKK